MCSLVRGNLIEVNGALVKHPELLQTEHDRGGYLCVIEPADLKKLVLGPPHADTMLEDNAEDTAALPPRERQEPECEDAEPSADKEGRTSSSAYFA
jgi:hypothetical protein